MSLKGALTHHRKGGVVRSPRDEKKTALTGVRAKDI